MIKLYEDYQKDLPAEEINAVKYGNTTLEQQEKGDSSEDPIKKFFIDKGLAEKIIREAPTNYSDITQNDLQTVMSMMKSITPEDLVFARQAEESREQVFLDFFAAKGIKETMGELKGVDSQSESILFYLKNEINRPRPSQLAYFYKFPLYPIIPTDAMSASYPGGHAISVFILAEYYSRKYPVYRGELEQLAERIAESRIKMGLHYPSDTEISRYLCKLIWKYDLIRYE
jgi:hypothetical protein